MERTSSVPASIAFPIIEGLRSETVCEDDRILELVPVERVGFEEAVAVAMDEVRSHDVETRWTNASLPGRDRGPAAFAPADFPIFDRQRVDCDAPTDDDSECFHAWARQPGAADLEGRVHHRL